MAEGEGKDKKKKELENGGTYTYIYIYINICGCFVCARPHLFSPFLSPYLFIHFVFRRCLSNSAEGKGKDDEISAGATFTYAKCDDANQSDPYLR